MFRARVDRFEDQLKSTSRELDIFMKKDPPVLTMDEMRSSVQVIDKLDDRSKQVPTIIGVEVLINGVWVINIFPWCYFQSEEDLKDINQEEVFLDWDPSAYPLLEKIQSSVEKYMTLWHTGKGH